MSNSILIVDDEEQLKDLIAAILSGAGYKVFATENGEDALKILDGHDVDLIITDIIMPDMEGIEFINIVKSERKLPAKIIAMSGSGRESTYLKMALTIGANATLEKPFSVAELLDVVKKVLNKTTLKSSA